MKTFDLEQHKGYFASEAFLEDFVTDLRDSIDRNGSIVLLYKGKPILTALSNQEVMLALIRLSSESKE